MYGMTCRYLEWDSNFFGCRIARADVCTLDAQGVQEVLSWCAVHSIDCLYLLTGADDPQTVHLLEENGFQFVDIRLTLECTVKEVAHFPEDVQPHWSIRCAREEDIPVLRAIARVSHRNSRFYFDIHFPVQMADALYETWIERSCNGYANVVWVAEFQGKAVGYLSCHLLDDSCGQIGLFGVDEVWQGYGIGRGLLRRSLKWFRDQNVSRVSVVTQGRNVKAQRLYARHGFLLRSVQLWYHRWFFEKGRI
jgi:dTDP-4-amino-4,6-dideoxy-D-galactose acyltransferase